MSPGPNRNVQSLSAASETARSAASGESWRRLTTPSTKDDPASKEDALDDSSSDVADGEELVLSPHDRVEHDGRSDVREDQQELQERAQVDLVVLAAAGDVPGRVVENGLEENRRRIDVRNVMMKSTPKMRAFLLVLSHLASLAACDGTTAIWRF